MGSMDGSSLAFLILAHTDPAHLTRLLAGLPPEAYKVLHIDRKARSLDDFRSAVPNVHRVGKRHDVHWGAFSMVDATLELLRFGVERTKAERFVLLSGSCYPLKPNAALVRFFDDRKQHEFIKFVDVRQSIHLERLERFYIPEDWLSAVIKIEHPLLLKVLSRTASHALKPFRRRWQTALPTLVPSFGSQWWAITRACAECVIEASTHLHELKFFRHTFAPDELFFHTIIANSRFREMAGGLQQYEGRGNWRLANLHLINKGSLTRVYTHSDWSEIAASNKLFVRKLTGADSGNLILRIERELRGNPGFTLPDLESGL